MFDKRVIKGIVGAMLPVIFLAGCATTGSNTEQPQLTDHALTSIHLGLKTPNPAKCRFVKTLTIKFHNHWLKAHMSSHELREDALKALLQEAVDAKANYIHVRQISAETMGVFAYNFTSSVLVTGDAFKCHKMPEKAQSAQAYLQQQNLKLES